MLQSDYGSGIAFVVQAGVGLLQLKKQCMKIEFVAFAVKNDAKNKIL